LEAWRDVLATKYSRGWLTSFERRMGEAGRQQGFQFNFDAVVGNSLKSLRLLRWARRYNVREGERETTNVQELLADVLARYHFEEATTVGKEENLFRAVEEVNRTLARKGSSAELPLESVRDILSYHPLDAAVTDNPHTMLYTFADANPFLDPSRMDLCQELALEVLNELRQISAAGVSSIPVVLFFVPSSSRPVASVHGSAPASEFYSTIKSIERNCL